MRPRLKELVTARATRAGWNDAWEIEVAALLAQVGAITLPGETAEKLYSGAQLTFSEQQMVARVPAVTLSILGNIPRLDGVLQILKHHHRRFDSIGTEGLLPVGARMLRIGLDFLELEGEDMTPLIALETMRGRAGKYDPELLEAFALTIGVGDERVNVIEVGLDELVEGMRLVGDVRDHSGHLLIARGHLVTPELLERLSNFPVGSVREPLRVTETA